jgi:sensor domain CHASE-containing protein
MIPLAKAQPRLKPSLLARFSARRAPLVFALSFVVGMGAVAWRAKGRIETARAVARTEALATGGSIEVQLSQASTAAEVLGMLAKQGRGGLTNFQKVATELLAAHSGLASLELQPGGVVSDIVPRAGHERTIGFNVLKDAAQRVGANEAIARRVSSVACLVTLDHGERGIVVRVPVFKRAPDGRDSFWGFVAVSMRLQEALSRVQVDELALEGYDFAFFAPSPVGKKAIAIASHGLSSLQDSVQQAVRVQNLEFRLALKPHGGWNDKTKLVLESLAVLIISALVSLLVSLLQSRRALEAELTEATRRLAREGADRSHAPADCRRANEKLETAQAEFKQTRLALQKAESEAAQFQARLDANIHVKDEAARISQAELKNAQAALQKAQGTIAQLQARLDAAAQAEKDATSAAEARLQQQQAAMAELQDRLEAATRSVRETAETDATRVAQLEQRNRELEARLLQAEQAQARVIELTGLLQTAQEELRLRQEGSTGSAGTASAELDEAIPSQTAGEGSRRKLAVESSKKGSPAPALPVNGDVPAKVKEDKRNIVPSEHSTSDSIKLSTLGNAPSPSSDEANSLPPLEAEEASVEAASPAQPSVTHKAVKAARRKKARRDDQLHLFGTEISTAQAANQPVVEAQAQVLAMAPAIPGIEIAAPSETPSSDGPKTPTGQEVSRAPLQKISKRSGPEPQPTLEPATAGVEVEPTPHTPPPDLPVIDGLATSEGLANADGDPKHYLKALRQFVAEHAGAPEKIRDVLLHGDLPAAQRAIQALKTAADMIGATAVHKATTALAHACHERSDPSEIESIWGGLEKELRELTVALKPVVRPKEEEPAPSRRLPAAPPVDPGQLRKAVNMIVPLLTERDPGAKDCLRDNRKAFRSAFIPEAYVEFEQLVKDGDSDGAFEQLKKAARKHGISL